MRINYPEIAPEALKALYNTHNYLSRTSVIDAATRHLVELRVSQMNGCAFCLDMHSRELRALGESQQRLDCLPAWRETQLFTDREKAILGWAEAVTLIAETHAPDAAYERLREFLSEREVVDLQMVICQINTWNRFAIGFRSEPAVIEG